MRIHTPIEAFGGSIAQALQGLGKTMEHSSDELFQTAQQLQSLRNETTARQAATQYEIEQGKLHVAFTSQKGLNAAQAFPKYMQDSAALREKYGANLNPMARKMYDSDSYPMMGRSIFNGAGHAGAETDRAYEGSLHAQAASATAGVTLDQGDDSYHNATGRVEGITQREGEFKGWTPEQIAEVKAQRVDNVTEHRLVAMSRYNPFEARRQYEKLKPTIKDQGAIDKIENALTVGEAKNGALQITNEVTRGLTAESTPGQLGEAIDEGLDRAKKLSPNNLELHRNVEGMISAKYNRLQAVARDDMRADQKLVGDWANGGGDPTKAIKNRAQISEDPVVYDAYSRLGPNERKAIDAQIDHNAKMDSNLETPERKANYTRLTGMPGAGRVKEFNALDLNTQDLTAKNRAELIKTQVQTRKGETTEAHSQRVMSDPNVKSMLMNADIISRENGKPYNVEEYTRLHGMVGLMIRNEFERTGKWPTVEAEHAMVSKALRMEGEYPGRLWGVFGSRTSHVYQEGLPPDVKSAITRQLQAEGVAVPTDEEIMQRAVKLRQ